MMKITTLRELAVKHEEGMRKAMEEQKKCLDNNKKFFESCGDLSAVRNGKTLSKQVAVLVTDMVCASRDLERVYVELRRAAFGYHPSDVRSFFKNYASVLGNHNDMIKTLTAVYTLLKGG